MWRPEDQYGTGTVWHRRRAPKDHRFRYRLWFSLLDVDRLEQRFARSRWWSMRGPGLVSFRRGDFLGPSTRALGEAVRDRVEQQLGERPDGTVRMLAHLRQWGLCFNPVTFYFAHRRDGRLLAVIAEVHNTPWDERHAYVLDARDQSGPEFRFRFGKAFHVSPFLPMDLDYDWRFRLEAERLFVHMRVTRGDRDLFGAGMDLALNELDAAAMRRLPIRFPLLALKVVGGIYWQALKLYVKRIPFFEHPSGMERPGAGR